MMTVLFRLLALAGAALAAVLAWVATASITPGFEPLAVAALAAFLVVGYLLLRSVDQRRAPQSSTGRYRLAWLTAGALVYVILAHFLVGRPPTRTLLEMPAPPPGLGQVTLPDGGTLAYLAVGTDGTVGHTPVVMLHGGPGVPILPTISATGAGPLDFLSGEGFPVYYYDQRGAGFSSRLDLRAGARYTVKGHVADLETLRAAIGAERVILAGHDWGATLAAEYLSAHPDRVERLIALSPAPLWFPAFEEMVDPAARARLTEAQASALALLQRPPLRLVIGRLTATTSVRAAHSLVEDWEADQWWTRSTEESMRLGQPNMTCSTDPARGLPPLAGLGFFAYSYTSEDALRLPDPRSRLAGVDTPTLVLRGLCDHIRWEVAYEYLQVLPGAQYVSFPAAGHLIWLEQPEVMAQVIRAFVTGEVVPLTYYHPGREASRDGGA